MLVHSAKCQCKDHLFIDADRRDPTGTTGIRNEFEKQLVRRFKKISKLINQAIVQNDVFGLKKRIIGDSAKPMIVMDDAIPPPRAFEFVRSNEKVDQFMQWLRTQEDETILEIIPGARISTSANTAWSNTYIQTAYQKGINDAGAKLRKGGANVAESWTRSAFNRPIHTDRLELIYTRSFNQLNGITQAMDTQISRILAQGIAEGRGPMDIARDMANRVQKIGITRARVLARTEVISAHAEATLNSYREAGIEGVQVEAEFTTAGDDSVCEECEDLEGRTFSMDEAGGIIPVHPNCRCSWTPLVVDGTGIDLV